MSENVEGIRGAYRRLTPVEVGMVVRLYRHSHELKRTALAAQAHISDKTLERLEAGVPVREDSYRRVALAIGLRDDAFIKEEYIPTPEEYLDARGFCEPRSVGNQSQESIELASFVLR